MTTSVKILITGIVSIVIQFLRSQAGVDGALSLHIRRCGGWR